MPQTQRPGQVVLEGHGPLTLGSGDYVATGGEGSVWRKAGMAIKIYAKPAEKEREGVPEKIRVLSLLKHPFIIAPKGLVRSSSGNPIGFFMDAVDGEPLPRVFTNDFRARERFSDDDAKRLTHGMYETVRFAHDHKAIMGDPNELNWLAILRGQNGPEPRVIDVDSWTIGRWRGTVVMLSIRDWHAREFTEQTDWFAWGIVTFEVFTGIHPYKGKLDGFKPGDLEGRMRANASVFTRGTRLNRAVRDFSCIPGPLLDWYSATFQKGERTLPPSPLETGVAITAAAQVARVVVTATGTLIFEKLFGAVGDPVVRILPCGIALLGSGALTDLETKREIGRTHSRNTEVVSVEGGWMLVDRAKEQTLLSFVSKTSLQTTPLDLRLQTRKLIRCENRIFAITERGLTELVFRNLGKPVASAGQTWGVMVNATRWFDGVGIQDAMGATFLVTPFGEKSCAQTRVQELDGLEPIAARAGNRFVTVIALDTTGSYHKLEFAFNRDYSAYTLWRSGTDNPNLNIAILPKGVCATIVDDGELIIFVPASGNVNKVTDKKIATDMALANWEDRVIYIQNGDAWSVRMR